MYVWSAIVLGRMYVVVSQEELFGLFPSLEITPVVVVHVVVDVLWRRVTVVDAIKSLKKIASRPRDSILGTLRVKRARYQ